MHHNEVVFDSLINMADNFDRSLLVYGLLIKWVENIMDYNDNSMKAAYRCVVLAASGDGKVSDDELESALSNTEWTENYTVYVGRKWYIR